MSRAGVSPPQYRRMLGLWRATPECMTYWIACWLRLVFQLRHPVSFPKRPNRPLILHLQVLPIYLPHSQIPPMSPRLTPLLSYRASWCLQAPLNQVPQFPARPQRLPLPRQRSQSLRMGRSPQCRSWRDSLEVCSCLVAFLLFIISGRGEGELSETLLRGTWGRFEVYRVAWFWTVRKEVLFNFISNSISECSHVSRYYSLTVSWKEQTYVRQPVPSRYGLWRFDLVEST